MLVVVVVVVVFGAEVVVDAEEDVCAETEGEAVAGSSIMAMDACAGTSWSFLSAFVGADAVMKADADTGVDETEADTDDHDPEVHPGKKTTGMFAWRFGLCSDVERTTNVCREAVAVWLGTIATGRVSYLRNVMPEAEVGDGDGVRSEARVEVQASEQLVQAPMVKTVVVLPIG